MIDPIRRHLHLTVVLQSDWSGSTLIQLAPAPEKPGLGLPGKEAGSVGPVEVFHEASGERQRVLVSIGDPAKITAEQIRRTGAGIARWLLRSEIQSAGIELAGLNGRSIEHPESALAEGLLLGAYRFDRYQSSREEKTPPRVDLLVGNRDSGLVDQLATTQVIADAVNLVRDWAHEPASVINPVTLAERAVQVAEGVGLGVTVLDDTKLAELGAGAILAVGQGSHTKPRMIILEYPGVGESAALPPIALVGKAITFDTGGYSLKTIEGIQGMKYDKCGGLAVLAILKAAAELKLNTHLVGVICAAENMISEDAYRPDDIITSLSGKTIEVLTTDAEGRLVLADGLTYVQNVHHPREIIDLATLTGGVVVALGHVRAGIMSTDERLSQALVASGERTHERLWPLPLDDDYFQLIKSDEADIKNSGGREGAPIFGGVFLKQFIDDSIPWAHLDIAGTADMNKEQPYSPKGATGFGVRLLIDYLQTLE